MTFLTLLQITFWVMPLIFWLLNVLVWGRRIHWFFLLLLSSFAGFIVLMITVPVIDSELQRQVDRHDINGDGSISGSERTAEARKAMRDINSDTGRALAPVMGFPISVVWTAMAFTVIAVVDWTYRTDFRSFMRRTAEGEDDGDAGSVVINPDTGNPYQPPPQREHAK